MAGRGAGIRARWRSVDNRSHTPMNSRNDHPCRACGACCRQLPVSFHENEINVSLARFVEPDHPNHVRMRRADSGACAALEGTCGKFTTCTVYADRPSPCRDFEPSWEFGRANPHCDAARISEGMRKLRPSDWKSLQGSGT